MNGTVLLLDRDKLRPGDTCTCRLILSQRTAALAGDPFIIRGFETLAGRGRTIGGGRILHPSAVRIGSIDRAFHTSLLNSIRDGDSTQKVFASIEMAGHEGISANEALAVCDAGRLDLNKALGRLSDSGDILHFNLDGITRYVGRSAASLLGQDLLAALSMAHERRPDHETIPVDELLGTLSGRPSRSSVLIALRELASKGLVVRDDDRFRLPDHASSLSRLDDDLLDRVTGLYRESGLTTPTPTDAACALGCDPEDIKDAVNVLVSNNRLVRVSGGLVFEASVIESTKSRLIDFLSSHPTITTREFKDMLGVSRKYAIPLAEHFDSEHVTLRISNTERKLRGG